MNKTITTKIFMVLMLMGTATTIFGPVDSTTTTKNATAPRTEEEKWEYAQILFKKKTQCSTVSKVFESIHEILICLRLRTISEHRLRQLKTIHMATEKVLTASLPQTIVTLIVEHQNENVFNTIKTEYRGFPEKLMNNIYLLIEGHFSTKK